MQQLEEPIEILIHNPHSFGNKTAIDEMLASTALWTDIAFEKETLEGGNNKTRFKGATSPMEAAPFHLPIVIKCVFSLGMVFVALSFAVLIC